MYQFKCYYCTSEYKHLKDVIAHSVQVHNDEQLKIRSLTLNEVSGKITYVRKDFPIIPSEIKAEGKYVVVDDGKVFVEEVVNLSTDKEKGASLYHYVQQHYFPLSLQFMSFCLISSFCPLSLFSYPDHYYYVSIELSHISATDF